MMALVALFSYVSSRSGGMASQQPYGVDSAYASQAPSSTVQLVVHHGGVLEGERAVSVRRVGNELASRVTHLPVGTFRFYVLNDQRRAATYVLQDGTILMTAAQFDASLSETALAATLSQRIAEYVYQGYDRDQYPQVDTYSIELLAAAGYGPGNVDDMSKRSRMARGPANQPTRR